MTKTPDPGEPIAWCETTPAGLAKYGVVATETGRAYVASPSEWADVQRAAGLGPMADALEVVGVLRGRVAGATPPPELRELRAIVSCVRVVLYGDACEDAPCEDDECLACRSSARLDAYFRPVGGTIAEYPGVPVPEKPS